MTGDPSTLYVFFLVRGEQREIRSISEFYMFQRWNDLRGLEAFLRQRCNEVRFLGIVTIKNGIPDDPDGVRHAVREIKSRHYVTAPLTFAEGTDWDTCEIEGRKPPFSPSELN
jgi:hypothetical protein